MRYADIINDDEDIVVQMAKDRLNRSKIEKDKNRLRVKQAQERKLKKDIAAKQRSRFKETEPVLSSTADPKLEAMKSRTEIRDLEKEIAQDRHDIWVDHTGLTK